MSEQRQSQLSPAQHQAFAKILNLVDTKEPLIGLVSRNWLGRTTILKTIATHLQTPLITLPALLEKTHGLHPLHLEEGIAATFLEPLGQHDLVLIDDLHLLTDFSCTTRSGPGPTSCRLSFRLSWPVWRRPTSNSLSGCGIRPRSRSTNVASTSSCPPSTRPTSVSSSRPCSASGSMVWISSASTALPGGAVST